MDDKEFKVPFLPMDGGAPAEPSNTNKEIDDDPEQSDALQARPTAAACNYKTPKWSAPPPADVHYAFEVLKSGQIIDGVDNLQKQAAWIFGRLPDNDITMAHPTISRYHAVLQYKPNMPSTEEGEEKESMVSEKPAGWYIYDLNSTHGTFLNKQRVPPRVYIRVQVGHMLKLGASTRTFILQGPAADAEPETELGVTELRAQRQEQLEAMAAVAEKRRLEAEKYEGVSWGMADDAEDEAEEDEIKAAEQAMSNPYASTNNEQMFLDDPKRTLRGYYEREGHELIYKCDELSSGTFVCRVELPLENANGRPIVAEYVHKGRKKDCVVQCALEACRMLDRMGVLRQANQEPLKRRQPAKAENSDDDDDFLDRTGEIERKRQRKSNAAAAAVAGNNAALTYDELLKQAAELDANLDRCEAAISKYLEQQQRQKANASADDADLDDYMQGLGQQDVDIDKVEIKKLRYEQQSLKTEQQRLLRLIKIAKPTELSFSKYNRSMAPVAAESAAKSRQLPMIGKRNQFKKFKLAKETPATAAAGPSRQLASDEEEEDDEEDEKTTSAVDGPVKFNNSDDTIDTDKIVQPKSSEIPTELNAKPVAVEEQPSGEAADVLAVSNAETKSLPSGSDKPTKIRFTPKRLRPKLGAELRELEEHETQEKYAKWVPPENQTGDGMTSLNEKYGY